MNHSCPTCKKDLPGKFLKLVISPSTITVEPEKWVKPDPIVEGTSVYRPDVESVLHYEYRDKKYESVRMPRPVLDSCN